MADPYLGEIILFAGNFAPTGWAFCQGQTLAISSNTALFALLGTQFGGNGTDTFALPDLQGRVAIGQGSGAGLSTYNIGEEGGAQTVTLTSSEMPQHTHTLNASSAPGTENFPAGAYLAAAELGPGRSTEIVYGYATIAGATMASAAIGTAGSSQSHSNIQPYLALCYIIALQGVFPSRS